MNKITKLTLILSVVFVLPACGYESRTNEMSGQAKKVVNQTPLICGDRVDADVSLGIMKNGVGSMSTQDLWFTVPNESDQKLLKEAADVGAIVKITYDIKRVTLCTSDHIVRHVELVK